MTQSGQQAVFLSLTHRFVKSPEFTRFFKSGKRLVEVTADYLDGLGREESKRLEHDVARAYADQSMRLTTRHKQIVSWLLLMRAVSEGEIDFKTTQSEKRKVQFHDYELYLPTPAIDSLPASLIHLMQRTDAIARRIVELDRSADGESSAEHEEPAPEMDARGLQECLRAVYE